MFEVLAPQSSLCYQWSCSGPLHVNIMLWYKQLEQKLRKYETGNRCLQCFLCNCSFCVVGHLIFLFLTDKLTSCLSLCSSCFHAFVFLQMLFQVKYFKFQVAHYFPRWSLCSNTRDLSFIISFSTSTSNFSNFNSNIAQTSNFALGVSLNLRGWALTIGIIIEYLLVHMWMFLLTTYGAAQAKRTKCTLPSWTTSFLFFIFFIFILIHNRRP